MLDFILDAELSTGCVIQINSCAAWHVVSQTLLLWKNLTSVNKTKKYEFAPKGLKIDDAREI